MPVGRYRDDFTQLPDGLHNPFRQTSLDDTWMESQGRNILSLQEKKDWISTQIRKSTHYLNNQQSQLIVMERNGPDTSEEVGSSYEAEVHGWRDEKQYISENIKKAESWIQSLKIELEYLKKTRNSDHDNRTERDIQFDFCQEYYQQHRARLDELAGRPAAAEVWEEMNKAYPNHDKYPSSDVIRKNWLKLTS